MKFLKSVFISFTVWLLAALLNGIFAGCWLSFFSNEHEPWPGSFLLVFFFTLLFSLPGIFIFWLVLLINWDEEILFRSLLKTGFIISALSYLVINIIDVPEVQHNIPALSICILLAAVTTIMLHHSIIISIHKKNNQYV